MHQRSSSLKPALTTALALGHLKGGTRAGRKPAHWLCAHAVCYTHVSLSTLQCSRVYQSSSMARVCVSLSPCMCSGPPLCQALVSSEAQTSALPSSSPALATGS